MVCTVLDRVTIGQRQRDQVDVDGFTAVSAYQAQGSTQLEDNAVLTPLWRVTYGEPQSVPGFDTSFIGTRMHTRLYMAWSEDTDGFHRSCFPSLTADNPGRQERDAPMRPCSRWLS